MKLSFKLGRLRAITAAGLAVWMFMLALGSTAAFAEKKAADATASAGTGNPLGINAKAAILMEPTTGQVLYELNADEALPPASMTKMMTEYIVLEEIKAGRLTWDTIVSTSSEAATVPPDGSQVYLAEGEQHTVKELYIAMAVGSASDATIALAVQVGGSTAGFVDKMNETAQKLGLTSAHFTGPSGLEDTTVISARDMAKLASTIIRNDPEFLTYSSIPRYKFRARDKGELINYNWMLGSNKDSEELKSFAYPGVDGMKTGYIGAAGYCFTGTVEVNGLRYVSVVMNTKTKQARFRETKKLYDFGYASFEKKTIVAPKSVVESVKTVKITKGKSKSVPVITGTDVSFLVKKGTDAKATVLKTELLPDKQLVAPIKQGQKVGTVTYEYKNPDNGQSLTKTVDLIASKEVKKAGWFTLLFRSIGHFFSSLFSGIANLFG
ncbi:D-alanyl-D-alanine carboxypeptidase [Paenibacillus sp. MMS18-CY102]|nr:D-alanyl-D-alanine carboxypeptidase [Paenibacillus sp. MMS18-CY102]